MEELQELVRIVAKETLNRVDDLRDIASRKKGKTKITQLYHSILKRKISTDSQAAEMLGQEEGSVAYRSIKSRLKRKIYNSLYILDLSGPGTSDYYKASFECSRAEHFVRVLTWLGSRKAATRFSERMLAIAEKFELTESAVFFLRSLVQKTSDMEKKHDFYKYASRLKTLWELWMAEEQALIAYYTLQIAYAHTMEQQVTAGRDALKIAAKIKANINTQHTFTLIQHMYRLEGHGHYVLGHYQKSIEAWNALDQYYNENPAFDTHVRRGEIALQQMSSFLCLADYNHANRCVNQCRHYFSAGSINKMLFYESFILLLMYKGNYKAAANVFGFTHREIPWKEIVDYQKARWKLAQCYLYLVSEEDYKAHIHEPFKFSKTINDLIPISNDKRGLNVPLAILETCMYLKTGEEGKLSKSINGLKMNQSKYLRTGNSKRSQIFVKMLLVLDECNYVPEKAITTAAAWTKKLHDSPYTFPGKFEGLEVVPHEHLWEMVLGFAKKMRKK